MSTAPDVQQTLSRVDFICEVFFGVCLCVAVMGMAYTLFFLRLSMVEGYWEA